MPPIPTTVLESSVPTAPLRRLVDWIEEREAIRLRRAAGEPPPWTSDPILGKYRFCNVRRADDKVTRWLIDHWYKPHKDHPNMLAACALGRLFNLPSTLELISNHDDLVFCDGPPKWTRIKSRIMEFRKHGHAVFNGAYIVSTSGNRADKVEWAVDKYAKPLFENVKGLKCSSMQETHKLISAQYGFSSFMAGQVVADLRWALTGTWADRNTWAPMGPGSRRGMNALLERPFEHHMNQNLFYRTLRHVMSRCRTLVSPTITSRLEAMDYQNCLCEFFKYEKTRTGQGKPKQLYRA